MWVLAADSEWASLRSMLPETTWWQALLIAVTFAGVRVIKTCLAEITRARTLKMLVEKAPPGTVVEQCRGPGGPAMTIRIGDSSPERPGGDRGANTRRDAAQRDEPVARRVLRAVQEGSYAQAK